MAPRKRKNEGAAMPTKPDTTSLRLTRSMARQTRSSTQRTGGNSATKFVKLESPKRKKTKKAKVSEAPAKKKEKEKEKEEEAEEEEEAAEGKVERAAAEDGATADESKKKTIVIEHCKQCNSFKTRAIQVKEGLEKGVPGVTVVVNPEKPRRGCFEIREEGGEAFISLLDMKRPFAPMKALDMKEVIADVIEKIK